MNFNLIFQLTAANLKTLRFLHHSSGPRDLVSLNAVKKTIIQEIAAIFRVL